ncbi:hypothetical protein H4I96_07283 [Botrytis cinerea]
MPCQWNRTCMKAKVPGSIYCTEHKCKKCHQAIEPRSTCCSQHEQFNSRKAKCRTVQCTRPPLGNGIYCSQHKCHDWNCNMQKCLEISWCPEHSYCAQQNCDLPKFGNALICAAHKCQDPSCVILRFGLSKFCGNHKCHSDGCLRRKCGENHIYCDFHSCYSVSICQNMKDLHDGRVHCQIHNCSKPGCLSPKIAKEKFCENHGRVY